MRKLIVKINYAIWAFKRMNRPHLGDVVIYKGERCFLIQGVANPYWDLLPLSEENLAKPKRDIYRHVHISEFKMDNSIKRKVWAFKESYKFKMQNWFSIDTWHKSIFAPVSNIG